MDEIIFELYLKEMKKENKFTNVLKKSSKLIKTMVIFYFILIIIFVVMVIGGCFYPVIVKFSWISLILLVLPATVITITAKKSTNINDEIISKINQKKKIKELLENFNIKTSNQIETLYERLKGNLKERNVVIENKKNNILKIYQIIIIPICLALFNQIISGNYDYNEMILFCILFIFALIVATLATYAISEAYTDIISSYCFHLKNFLSLLQDIIEFDNESDKIILKNIK